MKLTHESVPFKNSVVRKYSSSMLNIVEAVLPWGNNCWRLDRRHLWLFPHVNTAYTIFSIKLLHCIYNLTTLCLNGILHVLISWGYHGGYTTSVACGILIIVVKPSSSCVRAWGVRMVTLWQAPFSQNFLYTVNGVMVTLTTALQRPYWHNLINVLFSWSEYETLVSHMSSARGRKGPMTNFKNLPPGVTCHRSLRLWVIACNILVVGKFSYLGAMPSCNCIPQIMLNNTFLLNKP